MDPILSGLEVARKIPTLTPGGPPVTPPPASPSGFVMPTTDPVGYTRVFEDDFTSYGTVALGSFPAATNGRWGGYGAGTLDTSGHGEYNMGKTISISSNGVLDIQLWSEMVGGVQKTYVAAPWPVIPGNQPDGLTIDGVTYGTMQVRANIFYGQIEFAFRSGVADRFKTAWLLWPDSGGNLFPKYGEIDFPEANLDGVDTMHAFMHRDEATSGSDQDSRDSGVVFANNVWHKGKIVWDANICEFWLDGVKLGATITSRVPDHPMHWVFQTETQLNGGAPIPLLGTVGHVQLDWVVMWQRDGVYSTTPPPVTSGNRVTLGAASVTSNTLLGWTSVHQQDRGDANTKVVIGECSEIQNQHAAGFGNGTDLEVKVLNLSLSGNVATLTTTPHLGWKVGDKISVLNCGSPYNGTDMLITALTSTTVSYAKTGANQSAVPAPAAAIARNFDFLDGTYGYPSKGGYFTGSQYQCLTACGCPPYMKIPKSGASPNPMGTPSGLNQSQLESYYPPNWSYFTEYGALIAACVARYPHLTHIQVWNENKGFYIGASKATGSNMVPTGSGLVADTTLGTTTNRWWTEGHTAMYNEIWRQCKAIRNIHITGPYCVLNSFNLTNASDWANDAFPLNYMGSWGYGDKKILAHLMYFIRYSLGADSLCVDIRNLQKGSSVTEVYNPASIPAAPDPGNSWLSNPEGGIHPRYWSDGWADGAWLNGQRQIDIITWLRALGASSAVYQRPECDARTLRMWYAEWYAYANHEQFKKPNPATGNYYNEATSTHAEETAAFAWQYIYSIITLAECAMAWKPEGNVQGNVVDPADSNPLALYEDNDASVAGRTPLYTLCKALKDNFPKGTQLYSFTSNMSKVWGMASNTMIMLVSRDSQPITFTLINPKNNTPSSITLAGYEVRFLAR